MSLVLITGRQTCVRELLAEALTADGYEVVAFAKPEQLENCIDDLRPDLVLLDIYPDFYEEAKLLQELKQRVSHIPVLLISAHEIHAYDPRLKKANGFVLKSLDFSNLKRTVAATLANRPSHAEVPCSSSSCLQLHAG